MRRLSQQQAQPIASHETLCLRTEHEAEGDSEAERSPHGQARDKVESRDGGAEAGVGRRASAATARGPRSWVSLPRGWGTGRLSEVMCEPPQGHCEPNPTYVDHIVLYVDHIVLYIDHTVLYMYRWLTVLYI